jgi:hypothetical protein
MQQVAGAVAAVVLEQLVEMLLVTTQTQAVLVVQELLHLAHGA